MNYLIKKFYERKSHEQSTRRFRDRLNYQFNERTKFIPPILNLNKELEKVRMSKVSIQDSLIHGTNTKTKN